MIRSVGFYSREVRRKKNNKKDTIGGRGGGRGERYGLSIACVKEEEIALLTAVSPQVKYYSTGLREMTEEYILGRNKSGETDSLCRAGYFLSLLV